MTLPLRMVQANATAAAEQPCAAPIRARVGITQQAGVGTAERRIGHQRHAALLAPRQQITFNAAVADIVKDLIGRAAIAMGNMEKLFHVADFEVGDAPGANLSRCDLDFQTPSQRSENSVIPLGQCNK